MNEDLYLNIRDDIRAVWDANWSRTDVPVLWRGSDLMPIPDPGRSNGRDRQRGPQHFFRNEIDFGAEEVTAIGGGRGKNLRTQYGSLVLRSFSALSIGEEDEALRLMGAATAIFRSYREQDAHGGDLSFIGSGSGFDWGPTEDGNWFMRGALCVFQYRFLG
jgi:hypothetical protein